MALTPTIKQQIDQWYKALQQHIPDFISRTPQRQMIAEVAKILAGEYPRHAVIEAPTSVGKTLSYLIPGIAIARAESKTLVISTANIALQDQIVTKDQPLLKKFIPELTFTAAFGRARYLCQRNLAALTSETAQGDFWHFSVMNWSQPAKKSAGRVSRWRKRFKGMNGTGCATITA